MPSNTNNYNRLDKMLEKLLSTYTRKTLVSMYQIQCFRLCGPGVEFVAYSSPFFFLLLFLKLYFQNDKSRS